MTDPITGETKAEKIERIERWLAKFGDTRDPLYAAVAREWLEKNRTVH